ncbi:cytochrome P450 [Phenylobacterium sp. LjRoot219]|uniref:cytochrome P450 n=1 Tax=Phenylobacterium sp. LjRoot219 TaxID=3342283 RepID=UPI003ECD6DB3
MSTDIPVVDPKEIPMIVQGDDDWRARFDALREAYPFFRVGDDPMIWSTRYDAAVEVFKNGELFWQGPFGDGPHLHGFGEVVCDNEQAEAAMRRHVLVRQALMPMFTPARVQAWEGVIDSVGRELIDGFAKRGHCDFVHDFARLFFPRIGADMLGAPKEDWDQLCEWEHEAFKVPAGSQSAVYNLDNAAVHNVVEYVAKLMADKRANPDDRFASWVVKLQDEGQLTPEEATWAMQIFVFGSGHTVASHLTYVFRYLADHPELQARLAAEPDCVNAVCEELLRLYPIGGHMRTVTADTVFHGLEMKKGTKIFINYSMVNRDPRVPGFDRVDFDRKVNKHLAFNQGWRQCIGLFFARRARNFAVSEWHKKIPQYSLDRSEPLVDQVYAGVGYHALPLKWDAA